MTETLRAGAAQADVTPLEPEFLFGYPHVARMSTGVHDPLYASALYLTDGASEQIFVGVDIIFVPKDQAQRVRERIAQETGVPREHIMVSATHTHSGPITVYYLSNEADPVVPRPTPAYMQRIEDGIVAAAVQAKESARDAEAGLVHADASCVGTNRRDPQGPADPQAPVLIVREAGGGPAIACMLVVSMHPTVLHEDSTLVSGDFPGMARQYLQESVLGDGCPVVYHTGPCGNQSPRHVTRGNTFKEAARLGHALGRSVEQALGKASFTRDLPLRGFRREVSLPLRRFPPVQEAEERLARVKARLDDLRAQGAPRAEVRTAECDWFGAEETVVLARAAASGRAGEAAAQCMPAEVQVFSVGPWNFVGWQGEVFVEFGLEVKQRHPNTYIISMANGELQGYLVTAEALAEGGYEASNALFQSPESGEALCAATHELLARGNG